MSFFKKASRTQKKLRLALCGVSGSGKTYSALTLAKGMGIEKIAVIDTERGSAALYCDIIPFDVCEMEPPYSPENYVKLIKAAENEGYGLIIVDSLSHAWSGTGGALDLHDKITSASASKNAHAAWRQVTPEHNRLVDALVQCKVHIICTMRSKVHYDIVSDANGRKVPVKLGLEPVQRAGMDHEFDIVLDLSSPENMFSASKDRTKIFKGRHDIIKEEHAQEIIDFLNTGDPLPSIDEIKIECLSDIEKASNLDELKYAYLKAYNSQVRNNEELFAQIIQAKDAKKSTFINGSIGVMQ